MTLPLTIFLGAFAILAIGCFMGGLAIGREFPRNLQD